MSRTELSHLDTGFYNLVSFRCVCLEQHVGCFQILLLVSPPLPPTHFQAPIFHCSALYFPNFLIVTFHLLEMLRFTYYLIIHRHWSICSIICVASITTELVGSSASLNNLLHHSSSSQQHSQQVFSLLSAVDWPQKEAQVDKP